MALQISINFRGILVPNAYVRVVLPTVSMDKQSICYGLHFHASAGELQLETKSFESPYDLDGANPLRQAYDYIKSLPEYADAIDV